MSDERIGWLRGILTAYEEDEKMFGLTPTDEARVAAWREELALLTRSKGGSE